MLEITNAIWQKKFPHQKSPKNIVNAQLYDSTQFTSVPTEIGYVRYDSVKHVCIFIDCTKLHLHRI